MNSEFQSPLCMVYEYAPIRPLIDEDRLKLMKLLIDFGANVNVRSGENSTTLLHKAILRKKVIKSSLILLIIFFFTLCIYKKKKN